MDAEPKDQEQDHTENGEERGHRSTDSSSIVCMDEEAPPDETKKNPETKPIYDGEKGQMWLRCPGWEVWFGGLEPGPRE